MSGSKTKPKTNAKRKAEAKPKRDDFVGSTPQKIRDSAGNVCSYPGCHVHTHGAKSNGGGTVSVGVACHIKAAAPGGPRYDEKQTSEQRRHFDNGIWMCQTHSRLIDADDSAFSVETLLQWKRDAEARSNSLLNQKSFTEKEVKVAAEQGSVDLLHRFVNRASDPLETPVAEIVKGYESNLENLDSRFTVEVNKSGNHYTHVIQVAQDKVSIDLVLQNLDKLDDFWAAQRAFVEDGRELRIPGKHFELKGSKLFDAIQHKANGGGQGVLTIGGVKKPIAANLYIRTDGGSEVFIESFTCYYTSGTVRTVFEGSALEGFIAIKAHCSHEGQDHQFDLTFNLQPWKGKNILELPRFARLLKAAQLMDKGRLVFELEVGSNAAAFDSRSSMIADEFHAQLQWVILYLDVARKIAEQCGKPVLLNELDFDYELYKELKKYVKLLAGPIHTQQAPGFVCSGVLDEREPGAMERAQSKGCSSEIKLAQENSLVFGLFGTVIRAPRREYIYTGVETFYFSDIEERGKPRVEIHATPETSVLVQLQSGEAWTVLDDWDGSELPAVIG
ncbi:hypothetical protein [Pseudomonas vranovensis]|uniref:hypothetical protein n=1 Tax=Pseudomonas vranovensis TaxID=321661 RepID=UPI003D98FE56